MSDQPRILPGGVRELGPVIWTFSRIAGRATRTAPPAIFTTLGRGRGLFWGWLHFAGKLMPGGKLPRRETEMVILRVASLRGCDYEFEHHVRLGRRAGVRPEDVERIKVGSGAEGWQGHEQLLMRVTEELQATRDLSDATWADLRAVYDERTSIELLLLIGHYDMLATTLMTLRLRPDAPR
ncbi:carboxymuconolactone decarboxylase family protein [Nocardioides marmoriginsengisoli]|uniref:Carboxymuconolactone decarboxylase family protein n=1 Tax=Nocardioides marmoriginsengisoli TaxID=661483 RepID=A0A3N0CNA6_9ACTN|nr:carboxymuconolactone decarboxylase family protein [Nocardioides marmoriginsengisoli]RNL64819.1 carboxymuconolactone decarboxylase family protein [Nocardioides marmoriginsengisoli]